MKRFAKHLLKGGKASHAEKIMYATLYRLKNQIEDDPLYVIQKAVEHSQPLFTLKKKACRWTNSSSSWSSQGKKARRYCRTLDSRSSSTKTKIFKRKSSLCRMFERRIS
jgi:ribosomal protein S7